MPFLPDGTYYQQQPAPVAPIEPQESSSFIPDALALGARVAGPVAGVLAGGVAGFGAAGPPGALLGGWRGVAAGSALGESVAQVIERATDRRDHFEPLKVAESAALGALPLGKIGQAVKAAPGLRGLASSGSRLVQRIPGAVAGAVEGGVAGTGVTTLDSFIEDGAPPSLQEVGRGAAAGALLGAGLGAAGTRVKAPAVEAAEAAAAKGPPRMGLSAGRGSDPEILRKAAENDFGGDINVAMQASVSATENLVNKIISSPELLADMATLPEFKDGKRIFIVAGALAKKHGLVDDPTNTILDDLQKTIAHASSFAGQTNQQYARLREAFNEFSSGFYEGAGASHLKTGWFSKFNNLRRALMVQQFATGVRNTVSQTARFSLEVVDKSLQALISGNADEARAYWGSALRPGTAIKEAKEFLSGNEAGRGKLLDMPYLSEVGMGGEAMKWVKRLSNLGLNEAQERFFRLLGFHAQFKAELAKRGIDYKQVLANPNSAPLDAYGPAIEKALQLTFQQSGQSRLGRGFLKIFTAAPPLTAIVPYPRFMVNSLKFLTDYNPAGIFKLFNRDATENFFAADPAKVTEAMSKAFIGTMGLAGAMALDDYKGGHWYEVNISGIPVDLRPFNPFSGFLFLGSALNEMSRSGNLNAFGYEDFRDGLLAMRGLGNLGLLSKNIVFESGSVKNAKGILESALGEYLSGFTVPFQTYKDLLSGGIPQQPDFGLVSERQRYDVREAPISGPALANIPFGAQKAGLPPRYSPTTGEQRHGEFGLFRQATGFSLSPRPEEEQRLINLGLEPHELGPELKAQTAEGRKLQRITEKLQGEVLKNKLSSILDNAERQRTPEEKKQFVKDMVNRIRAAAERRAKMQLTPQERAAVEAERTVSSLPTLRRQNILREKLGFGAR